MRARTKNTNDGIAMEKSEDPHGIQREPMDIRCKQNREDDEHGQRYVVELQNRPPLRSGFCTMRIADPDECDPGGLTTHSIEPFAEL